MISAAASENELLCAPATAIPAARNAWNATAAASAEHWRACSAF